MRVGCSSVTRLIGAALLLIMALASCGKQSVEHVATASRSVAIGQEVANQDANACAPATDVVPDFAAEGTPVELSRAQVLSAGAWNDYQTQRDREVFEATADPSLVEAVNAGELELPAIEPRYSDVPPESPVAVCVYTGNFGPPRRPPGVDPDGEGNDTARSTYDAIRLIVGPSTPAVQVDTMGFTDANASRLPGDSGVTVEPADGTTTSQPQSAERPQ